MAHCVAWEEVAQDRRNVENLPLAIYLRGTWVSTSTAAVPACRTLARMVGEVTEKLHLVQPGAIT
jgi:hypothetical protein